MTRFILIFSGALFLASIAAFFLFVPPLLIASTALVLMGFMLMFVLGVQVGIVNRQPLALQVEIRPTRVQHV